MTRAWTAITPLVAIGGCLLVEPVDDVADDPSTASAPSSSGVGGGGGGTGGATGGGGQVCVPDVDTQPCYDGPANTAGIGLCKAGTQTCLHDGSDFGRCVGQVLPALEVCSTAEDEDCDGVTYHLPLSATLHGDASEQMPTGGGDADAAGNFVVTGGFAGALDLGKGPLLASGAPWDVFVALFDSSGAATWSKRFGDAALQWSGKTASHPSGDVIAVGWFTGNIDFGPPTTPLDSPAGFDGFVARLEGASGEAVWAVQLDATGDLIATATAVDPMTGDVLATGFFKGTVDLGGGPVISAGEDDVFLVKLDGTSGAPLWSKVAGDASGQSSVAVATDDAGNVAIAGWHRGSFTISGDAVTAGIPPDQNALLAMYGPAGQELGARSYGGSRSLALQIAQAVDFDAFGRIVLTGQIAGTVDLGGPLPATSIGGTPDLFVLVVEPGPGFEHVHSGLYGGAAVEGGIDVAVDPATGDVLVVGAHGGSFSAGGAMLPWVEGQDIFLARYDGATGVHVCSRAWGGIGDQYPTGIAITPGGITIVGANQGEVDFGLGTLASTGALADVFIARLGP